MSTDIERRLMVLFGLTQGEVRALPRADSDNLHRLAGCVDHKFEAIAQGARYRCIHCSGEVDAQAFAWYRNGRAHGLATLCF